jgi:hypothetical protein
MNAHNIVRSAVVSVALAAGAAISAPALAGHDNGHEVVIEWNQLLTANIPSTAGLFGPRYYAMLHIAMFDAVNSIEGNYRRYHVDVHGAPGGSAEAAAAQAARDVLSALIPAAQGTFDTALNTRLAKIPPGRAAIGRMVGRKVAQAIIDWRTLDGSEKPNLPYTPPALPGLWQPTATGQVATFVQFAGVEPFGLLTPTQYLPDPPPQLNSPAYATDFNDVKAIGAVDSATRTAEQTLLARTFAGVGYGPNPFVLWNNVARDVAASRTLSLSQTARLFAMLNAAMHDGLQTSHTSKFIYGLWRPVTAINGASTSINPQTAPLPGWAPLLTTPPYPSHSSNMTCIGASSARAIARAIRTDAVTFNVTWTGTGGNTNVTRPYTSLAQLAEDQGLSRVYGGIHFRFELTASHESCRNVADYIADNYMRPR